MISAVVEIEKSDVHFKNKNSDLNKALLICDFVLEMLSLVDFKAKLHMLYQ